MQTSSCELINKGHAHHTRWFEVWPQTSPLHPGVSQVIMHRIRDPFSDMHGLLAESLGSRCMASWEAATTVVSGMQKTALFQLA